MTLVGKDLSTIFIVPAKAKYLSIKFHYFLIFKHALGIFIKAVLLGNHNICFGSETRKIIFNSVVLSRGPTVNAKYHLIGLNEKYKWPEVIKLFYAQLN